MSEEVQKSVAEELKDLLDAAVAEKANKEDLEGLVKEEALEEKADKADLEGIVKSEELEEVKSATAAVVAEAVEAAKNEVREEMEAKFAQAPAVIVKKEESPMEFTKFEKSNGEVVDRAEVALTKAELGAGGDDSANNGAMVAQNRLYYTLEQFNPFRGEAMIMPVTSGSIKLPSVSAIDWAVEGSVPLLNARGSGGGTLSTRTVNVETYTSWNSFSKPNLEDIQGVREMVMSLMIQEYSKTQAEDTFTLFDDALNNTNSPAVQLTAVNTGAAAALFASGSDIIQTMADLMDGLPIAYRMGARFHVSTNVYKEIVTAARGGDDTAGFVFDPATSQMMLFGYPLVINGYLDAGTGANDISALFGQFDRGLAYLERKSMAIEEYRDLNPGMVNYYGESRWTPVIWDEDSIVGLRTAA